MADNRQFTDHNSIGNVNVYYKDRQLKERTAVSNAASIANLKFLLTTGDDEGFRTAIKSYIDEAIRSALGALVDNLDKGTGVSRILGTDSSHDLGTITPANLASVLGDNGIGIKEHICHINDVLSLSYALIFAYNDGTACAGLYILEGSNLVTLSEMDNKPLQYANEWGKVKILRECRVLVIK